MAPERLNPLNPFLVDKLPRYSSLADPSLDVLCLLRALNALNRYWGVLYPVTHFFPVVLQAGRAAATLPNQFLLLWPFAN